MRRHSLVLLVAAALTLAFIGELRTRGTSPGHFPNPHEPRASTSAVGSERSVPALTARPSHQYSYATKAHVAAP